MMPIKAETNAITAGWSSARCRWCRARPGRTPPPPIHAHADLRQQPVALLGDLLAGVVVAPLGRCCNGGGLAICRFDSADIVVAHAGDIDVFEDKLRQRAGLAGGVDVDRRNTAFRVQAAAQGAAAVDHRHADLFCRRLASLKPSTAGQPVNSLRRSTIEGRVPAVMYTTFLPGSIGSSRGHPSRWRLFQYGYKHSCCTPRIKVAPGDPDGCPSCVRTGWWSDR